MLPPAWTGRRRRLLLLQLLWLALGPLLLLTTTTQAFVTVPAPPPRRRAGASAVARHFFGRSGGGGGGGGGGDKGKKSTQNPFAPELMARYEDGLGAKIWIYLFSSKIANVMKVKLPPFPIDYDEYVKLSQLLMKGGPKAAKGSVLGVLRTIAFPGFSQIFKTLFPGSSRLACEFNARITPVFFSWLVGPATVEKGEMVNPRTGETELWANSVRIQRCRYLEAVQCKGACSTVCKLPTQEFFTKDLGMPVTMNPNFEDLSCVMVFGQAPPPFDADPVATEPCYRECSTAKMTTKVCPKLAALELAEAEAEAEASS